MVTYHFQICPPLSFHWCLNPNSNFSGPRQHLVLCWLHPQNRTTKCLCNLWSLKPCCVNIPTTFPHLSLNSRHVYSSTAPPSSPNLVYFSFKSCYPWKEMFELSDCTRKHPQSRFQQHLTLFQTSYCNLYLVHQIWACHHLFYLLHKTFCHL